MDSAKRKKYEAIIPIMQEDDLVMIAREELEMIMGTPIQPFTGDEFPMMTLITDEEFEVGFEDDFAELEELVETRDPKETIH